MRIQLGGAEAARINGAAVRSAVQEGVQRLEEALAVSRRIATWSLVAVALAASLCANSPASCS
jgi:hypothetical protein